MKIQNTLLIVTILILLNTLFYNMNTVFHKMEKPNAGFENNEKTIIQFAEKILEMNSNILEFQSKSQKETSINDLKELLLSNSREALNTQNELEAYINDLQNKLANIEGLPFGAAVPGANSKVKLATNKNFVKKTLAMNLNQDLALNYDLIDKMDEIYFSSSNEAKGGQTTKSRSTKEDKDLQDFEQYVKYVNPLAQEVKTNQSKGRDYVPMEVLLNTTNYYKKEELKSCLKAERLTKDLKGYCINLLVTDEMLPPTHPIFENFGGLMMEEVSQNEYRYFIGGFSSRSGADNHLDKVIGSKFPDAEVVFYKKGNRKSELWQFFFGPLG